MRVKITWCLGFVLESYGEEKEKKRIDETTVANFWYLIKVMCMWEFILLFLSLNTCFKICLMNLGVHLTVFTSKYLFQNMLEIFHNKFLSRLQNYTQISQYTCIRKYYKLLLVSIYLWIVGWQRFVFFPL